MVTKVLEKQIPKHAGAPGPDGGTVYQKITPPHPARKYNMPPI
jgi:hypothetical protein